MISRNSVIASTALAAIVTVLFPAFLIAESANPSVSPTPEASPSGSVSSNPPPYAGCIGKGCEREDCKVELRYVVAKYNGGPIPMDSVPFTLEGFLVKPDPQRAKGCGQKFNIKLTTSAGGKDIDIKFPANQERVKWQMKDVVLRSANQAGGAICSIVEAIEHGTWMPFKGTERPLASDAMALEMPLAACNVAKYCPSGEDGKSTSCQRYCSYQDENGKVTPDKKGCLCRYEPGTSECALACGAFDPAAIVAASFSGADSSAMLRADAAGPIAAYLIAELARTAAAKVMSGEGTGNAFSSDCKGLCNKLLLSSPKNELTGAVTSMTTVFSQSGRFTDKVCTNLCKVAGDQCKNNVCQLMNWLFEHGCTKAFTGTLLNECLKTAQLVYLGQGCGSELKN